MWLVSNYLNTLFWVKRAQFVVGVDRSSLEKTTSTLRGRSLQSPAMTLTSGSCSQVYAEAATDTRAVW